MRQIFALITLSMMLGSFSQLKAGEVDFEFAGNAYTIVTTGAVWSAASADAQSRMVQGVPGHLCIIESEAENTAIFDKMIEAGINTVAQNGGGIIYGWLGGSDTSASIPGASDGEFFWVDGSQFWTGGTNGSAFGGAYANFGRPQEPDNFVMQHHVGMALEDWVFGEASEWNDVNSEDLGNALGYCIEFELSGAAIFADDFETGNTSRWTAVVP